MNNSGKFSQRLWQQHQSGFFPVVPDLKLRSPQAGDLIRGRDPLELALSLAQAGAPALSVVTEPNYFGGSPALLERISKNLNLPVLRKDFITRPNQLKESKDLGASSVLLIIAMLEKNALFKLVEEALKLGLEPLVETHNEQELAVANELELNIVGINNRNILKLETDDGTVATSEKLASLVKPGVFRLSESAIADVTDVEKAKGAGVHGVLVGTAILKAEDPVTKYLSLCKAGQN